MPNNGIHEVPAGEQNPGPGGGARSPSGSPTGQSLTPGFYYDMSAEDYHADPLPEPSLSSGVARLLIDRSPLHAWTHHPRLNPAFEREEKKAMDFGSAAHELILGKGRGMQVVHAEDWRTKGAREARDQAYADGLTPILAHDLERAHAVADAFKRQIAEIPLAMEAFGTDARSEVVFVWREGKAWCRGMADRFLLRPNGTILVVDYKSTSASAHPGAVSRRLYDMGQDFQQAFYRRGIQTIDQRSSRLVHGYEALIITQEIEPPYALSATMLDAATWAKADEQVQTAISLWQRCTEWNTWPGYPPLVATAELPDYVERRWVDNRDAMRRAPAVPPGLTIISAG